MMDVLFDRLWYPTEVLATYGRDAIIYTGEAIFQAAPIGETQAMLKFYKGHAAEVPDFDIRIRKLQSWLQMCMNNLPDTYHSNLAGAKFDAFTFMDGTAVRVDDYSADIDGFALCFPQTLKHRLEPYFGAYCEYRFYERYRNQIPGGIETFLSLLPRVKLLIEGAGIYDYFIWHEFNIEPRVEKEKAELLNAVRSDTIWSRDNTWLLDYEVVQSKNLAEPDPEPF
ncbi:MAG: hypothetical protein KF687_05675 [Cyclobacteriaceae bacterium]|nr:hypothetical protein [Cyclobacteriaceae bacterium]